jgi:hypothetical protein
MDRQPRALKPWSWPVPEVSPSKYLVAAGWDDVPHLDAKTKAELLAATPPHLRKARSQGIPSLGAGAIYPLDEEEITVADFRLPRHFRRGYSLDVGWNRTACAWFAHDQESDVDYLYAEYYRGQAEPAVHALAIRSRGAWMRGCIDPAARGRSQIDGQQMFKKYTTDVNSGGGGLHLVFANNAVEAGLQAVWERLSTGRLKVFASCRAWLSEYRIYRRDENGKVVKENDHLMDCTRYYENTRDQILQRMPAPSDQHEQQMAMAAGLASDPAMGY